MILKCSYQIWKGFFLYTIIFGWECGIWLASLMLKRCKIISTNFQSSKKSLKDQGCSPYWKDPKSEGARYLEFSSGLPSERSPPLSTLSDFWPGISTLHVPNWAFLKVSYVTPYFILPHYYQPSWCSPSDGQGCGVSACVVLVVFLCFPVPFSFFFFLFFLFFSFFLLTLSQRTAGVQSLG